MLVKCAVRECSFNKGLFCTNKLLVIANNGQCKRAIKAASGIPIDEPVENNQKDELNVIEVEGEKY